MADNKTVDNGALADIAVATDEVTYSDDVVNVQLARIVQVTGVEGSKTVVDLPGDATNGLKVNVTLVPADPYGLNADAASASGSISAKLRAIATAFGVTALDLGSGTGGSRTLRVFHDTASVVPVTDNSGSLTVDAPSSAPLSMVGFADTITSSFTVGDSAAYSINDAISDSTSAPTSGGFTFTGAARASGGSGIITDLIVTTSNDAGTLLQGEIFIFDTAVTAVNTNSPFVISDSEALTLVGKIPFTLEDIGNNGFFHAQNLNIGYKCVGSANLRYLVRAKNAYTSAADVLTFRLKVLQSN